MASLSRRGPLCGHTRPQELDDGTSCRTASPHPGIVGGGLPVVGNSARGNLLEAARRAAAFLPGDVREQFLVLFSPKMIALTSATLAAWGIGQFLGYGEVVDAAMLGWGAYSLGANVFAAQRELAAYLKGAVTAKTSADLDNAGMHLAKVVSMVGVGVFVGVVFKVGTKVAGRAIATAGLEAEAESWLIKLGRPGEPPLVRARVGTAVRFLQRTMDERTVLSHLKAIDFSKEVVEIRITRNDILVQRSGEKIGDYFALAGTAGENLGISMAGRRAVRFRLKSGISSVTALESNTTPVVDTWTPGRARQVQVGSAEKFGGEDVKVIRDGEYTGGGGRQIMVLGAERFFEKID